MFYIITIKDNEEQKHAILDWDTKLDYMPNGYPRLVNKNIAFPTEMVFVNEYNGEIPVEVIPSKYCYTAEDGFYKNPNWHEPPRPIELRVGDLEEGLGVVSAELVGMINAMMG